MSASKRLIVSRRRFLTIGGASAMWLATGCRGQESAEPLSITTSTTALSDPSTTLPPPAD